MIKNILNTVNFSKLNEEDLSNLLIELKQLEEHTLTLLNIYQTINSQIDTLLLPKNKDDFQKVLVMHKEITELPNFKKKQEYLKKLDSAIQIAKTWQKEKTDTYYNEYCDKFSVQKKLFETKTALNYQNIAKRDQSTKIALSPSEQRLENILLKKVTPKDLNISFDEINTAKNRIINLEHDPTYPCKLFEINHFANLFNCFLTILTQDPHKVGPEYSEIFAYIELTNDDSTPKNPNAMLIYSLISAVSINSLDLGHHSNAVIAVSGGITTDHDEQIKIIVDEKSKKYLHNLIAKMFTFEDILDLYNPIIPAEYATMFKDNQIKMISGQHFNLITTVENIFD